MTPTLSQGLSVLVIASTIALSPPVLGQDEGKAVEKKAATQGDREAAALDAKKAILENMVLGKRDASIGKRVSKGLGYRAFIAELGRLHAASATFTTALSKLDAAADKPSDEARKASAGNLMKALLGDTAAKDGFLADRAAAKPVLASFKKNLTAMRRQQLVNFTNNMSRSGARFIGQFEPVLALGPDLNDIAIDLLEDPRGLDDRFRAFLVVGMRDFVKKYKLTKDQVSTLTDIAEDEFEEPVVALNLTALLAYAGHTKLYDAKVAELVKAAEAAKGPDAARPLTTLVNLQSVAEKNGDAAKTYRTILSTLKDADDNTLGTHYYNLACSLEKKGDRDGAIDALDKALEKTGKSLARGTLWIDRDIMNIRKDKRFEALLEKHGIEWPAALRPKSKSGEASKGDGQKSDK